MSENRINNFFIIKSRSIIRTMNNRVKSMNRRGFLRSSLLGLGTLSLTQQLSALEYYPKPSDKKIAILYSTWCGSARDAAVWISEGMGGIAHVFDVRENPDIRRFEYIVVGGSIRYGQVSEVLQSFIKENKEALKTKVCGLFVVCGNMRRPIGVEQKTMLIDNHLARLCGVTNVPSKVFRGRVTKILLEPDVRQMMERFEDYDDLKRPECLDFGSEILQHIK